MDPETERLMASRMIAKAAKHGVSPYYRGPRGVSPYTRMLHRWGAPLPANAYGLLCSLVRLEYADDAAYLIEKCGVAPVDPMSARESNIVHAACMQQNVGDRAVAIAARLFPRGLHLQDATGCTPLHDAVYYGVDPEAVRFLVDAGASLTTLNNARRTVCDMAANAGYMDAFRIFYAAGGKACLTTPRDDIVMNGIIDGCHACGRTAMAILGLRWTGSRIAKGNGRDVFRLVARMVWVYRMDEAWMTGRGKPRATKKTVWKNKGCM